MKSANKILLMMLFLPGILLAQTSSKTLVHSFNVSTVQVLELELPGAVEIVRWDNAQMRIEFDVEINHPKEALIKALVEAGRYRFAQDHENGSLKVTMPNIEKEVRIGGHLIEETFTYTVHLPENVQVVGEQALANNEGH